MTSYYQLLETGKAFPLQHATNRKNSRQLATLNAQTVSIRVDMQLTQLVHTCYVYSKLDCALARFNFTAFTVKHAQSHNMHQKRHTSTYLHDLSQHIQYIHTLEYTSTAEHCRAHAYTYTYVMQQLIEKIVN